MIQNIFQYYVFFKFILYFFTFTHVYYFIYNKCNIQKKITKNNKSKIISKPKSILAFIYFILLLLIFYLFTFKIILFILCCCIFSLLYLYNNISSELDNYLDEFNKIPIIIFFWKIFSTIFTFIYMCTNPINSFINKFIYKKILLLKNIINLIINLDTNSTEEENKYNKINKQLYNLKNNTDISKQSNFSEYIVKNANTKKEQKNNIYKKINNMNNIFTNDDINIEDITMSIST